MQAEGLPNYVNKFFVSYMDSAVSDVRALYQYLCFTWAGVLLKLH